ncbi:MAG: hypothetical protein WC787_04260 [Patescibacteria group bacterium]|jgi:hypothetical protein
MAKHEEVIRDSEAPPSLDGKLLSLSIMELVRRRSKKNVVELNEGEIIDPTEHDSLGMVILKGLIEVQRDMNADDGLLTVTTDVAEKGHPLHEAVLFSPRAKVTGETENRYIVRAPTSVLLVDKRELREKILPSLDPNQLVDFLMAFLGAQAITKDLLRGRYASSVVENHNRKIVTRRNSPPPISPRSQIASKDENLNEALEEIDELKTQLNRETDANKTLRAELEAHTERIRTLEEALPVAAFNRVDEDDRICKAISRLSNYYVELLGRDPTNEEVEMTRKLIHDLHPRWNDAGLLQHHPSLHGDLVADMSSTSDGYLAVIPSEVELITNDRPKPRVAMPQATTLPLTMREGVSRDALPHTVPEGPRLKAFSAQPKTSQPQRFALSGLQRPQAILPAAYPPPPTKRGSGPPPLPAVTVPPRPKSSPPSVVAPTHREPAVARNVTPPLFPATSEIEPAPHTMRGVEPTKSEPFGRSMTPPGTKRAVIGGYSMVSSERRAPSGQFAVVAPSPTSEPTIAVDNEEDDGFVSRRTLDYAELEKLQEEMEIKKAEQKKTFHVPVLSLEESEKTLPGVEKTMPYGKRII